MRHLKVKRKMNRIYIKYNIRLISIKNRWISHRVYLDCCRLKVPKNEDFKKYFNKILKIY